MKQYLHGWDQIGKLIIIIIIVCCMQCIYFVLVKGGNTTRNINIHKQWCIYAKWRPWQNLNVRHL